MNILVITGSIAEELIKDNIKGYDKNDLYIRVLPIPIAAFITPKLIVYHLKKENIVESIDSKKTIPVDNIDLIIIPGLVRQDAKYIEDQLNIKTVKGPSNAGDILLTLNVIGQIELSTTKPADTLIREYQHDEAMKIINQYDKYSPEVDNLLEKKENILIRDCPVGLDFPMRVLGEIANSSTLSDDELLDKVSYYIESGADMVDIGMDVGENNPDQAYHMIKLIRDNYDIPLSIDTMNPQEIKSGLEAGADLVLSLDHGNYDRVIDDIYDHDAKAVIIPTDYSKGYIPESVSQRVESLEKLDRLCSKITTIADLLLDPINSPSIVNSIQSYALYRKQNPHKQMFFGVGNVSELLDADSNGVNALLGGIAMEIGATILFTPEASLKTKNSISELKTASNMMFIAKKRKSIPKNLGLNLITLKDAFKKEDAKIKTDDLKHITAVADGKFIPDPRGSFKIVVEDNLIKAILFVNYEKELVITSTSARAIYEEILRRDYISRLEHAAYMGMELEKAEIALKLNKKYIQDFPIF